MQSDTHVNALSEAFFGQLALYSVAHFCVDFACGALVSGMVWPSDYAYAGVILYNGLAFAGQMPLGIWADKFNRNALVAAMGCALVFLGLIAGLCLPEVILISVILAGVGNAFFHLGGGIDVLNSSGERLGPLGIFVSPGALGLFLGISLAPGDLTEALLPMILNVLCAVGILIYQLKVFHSLKSQNEPLSFALKKPKGMGLCLYALLGLFLVVALRSYVGFALSFSWKTGVWVTVLTVALVAGKRLGGLLSDWIGLQKTAIATLAIAALAFLFPDVPAMGTLAVLFFNMTMPMTLWALTRIMSGARGFAFGTLTCALYVGWLPIAFKWAPKLQMGAPFAVLTIVSLALLIPALAACPKGSPK